MRKIIMAIISLVLCLAWAEVKAEKILETTSVKKYNQWVKKNKAKYPALKSILVQYSMEYADKMRKYTIEYYSADGEKIKEEIIEDSLTYVGTNLLNDRIFITKSDGYKSSRYITTIKDAQGKVIFAVDALLGYVTKNTYIEGLDLELSSGPEVEVRVFDENGQIVNKLKGFEGFDQLNYPTDERYSVFRAHHGYPGITYIMVGKNGEEVWRKEFREPVATTIFIAKDGTKVGINRGKIVSIYQESGGVWREYNPFDNKEFDVKSALSDNGDWLISGLHSRLKFYNNKAGDLMWQNDTILVGKKDGVRYVHIIGDGEKVLVLCWSHNLYIFDKDGKLLKSLNLNLGTSKKPKTLSIPDEKHPGYMTRKVVGEKEVLFDSWESEVVGNFLIITKELDPITCKSGTKGTTKIIHKISDN